MISDCKCSNCKHFMKGANYCINFKSTIDKDDYCVCWENMED